MDIYVISETLNNIGVKAYATTGKPANYSFEIDGTYVVWEDENTPCPTRDDFMLACDNMEATIKTNEYKALRATEYPDFRDYLDGIVKGDTTQAQAYIDACLAVKAKYPKAGD